MTYQPTVEAKAEFIRSRIAQFANERFAHEFNLNLASDPAINDQVAVEQSQAAIVTIDAAIANAQAQLDALTGDA